MDNRRMSLALVFAIISSLGLVEEGVYIPHPTAEIYHRLSHDSRLTIDHPSSDGFELYGPNGLKDLLRMSQIEFVDLDQENYLFEKMGNAYPSFPEIEEKLTNLNRAHPEITRLFSIGKSVEGRDLWVMEISKAVYTDLPLPEVKYISSMHGDEITGRELMLRLIEDLLFQYGRDQKISDLINNTRIFILPSMNPDGSFYIQRGNANFKDLNRSFPDFSTSDMDNVIDGREPETQAVMKFQNERNFSLSANFHGGAEVVSYMWDTVMDDHPLLPLLRQISLDYAADVPYMKKSNRFPSGITNGCAWYEVNSGMQDWSYHWYGDLQFTIELSMQKYPPYSQMDQFYSMNREALIQFLSGVHQGVGFLIEEKNQSGFVEIRSGSTLLGTYPFKNSYFYKVLEPGIYDFEIRLDDGSIASRVLRVTENEILHRGNFIDLSLAKFLK